MRILLFGASGQVGYEAQRLAAGEGITLVALDRAAADLTNPGEAARLIAETECDAVINAAAYTAVDKAESETDLAMAVNGVAPGEMAAACAAKGVPFIHFSTDYVFPGDAVEPYTELDATGPQGAYGRTKLAGEEAVLGAGGAAAVLRLSWVFSGHGNNFVKTMLRVGQERGSVRVVDDQIGKPTPASGAAQAAFAVAKRLVADPSVGGLYHFAGDRAVSWAGFAREIFEVAGLEVPVEPITTDEFPTPAQRPPWSVLDTSRFEAVFGRPAPDWRAELVRIIPALTAPAEN
ncbi:dTDP-4-dehydrorhamnose reductase [Hyphomonas adhaerens MHS-3]|uniref:dTDP-4-dehydrorhamnose reductase n=1 Tax=Hyphomonas adhaerens MHS-3 TaxID=1280949 RepID=A0A069E6P4_9PROT|nr:dTDP-4-dehydrorhamnose reductase [Hyphomonas adhaerens]KCZ85702.1 dTDP-4-dehydrorhamnose reductase [Hyphomonas adhaerens MHS-3]